MTPSTPPQVLEEQKKASVEAMQRIEEAEVLCFEAIEHVSQQWEALISDTELEQVEKELHATEEDFAQLKNGV